MNLYLLSCSVAVVATIIIAILTNKNIQDFRSALNVDKLPAQTANCFLLNVCLLVTWVVVLQSCIDVTKGALPSGLFSIFAFYFALAALLFNRIRQCRTVESLL